MNDFFSTFSNIYIYGRVICLSGPSLSLILSLVSLTQGHSDRSHLMEFEINLLTIALQQDDRIIIYQV